MKVTKKIISLVCALSLVLSMCVGLSAFADGDVITLEQDASSTNEKIVLNIYSAVDGDLMAFTYMLYKTGIPNFKSATITVNSKLSAATVNAAATNPSISFSTSTPPTISNGELLATYVIDLSSPLTKDFTLETFRFTASLDTDGDLSSKEITASLTRAAGTAPTLVVKYAAPAQDKFEAKVNGDEITFENANLSTDNKEIAGKAIKLFGKTFTVNAKSKFIISAKGESKTFGKTAAEYLGLEGDGEATGNVTVGVIFDKEQYSADDFEISAE